MDCTNACLDIFAVTYGDESLLNFDFCIERDDRDAIVRTQALDDAYGALFGGLERLAAHGTGAINHEGDIEGSTDDGFGSNRSFRSDNANKRISRISSGTEKTLFQGQDFYGRM